MGAVTRWIFIVIATLSCLVGGTSLSMWVSDRILRQPTNEFAFAVDFLHNGGLVTFAKQIGNAREEVLVCASEIASKAMLDALSDASRRGVKVRIILDGKKNTMEEGSPLSYLARNKAGAIWVTPRPLYAQFLLIDNRVLFSTASPWTTGASKELSPAFLVRNRGAGAQVREFFDEMLKDARRVTL
jgi:hypothetical protein